VSTEAKIQNLPQFLESLKAAQKVASDLSSPLKEIGRDWMRTNRTIFQHSGPGPFRDLSGGRARRNRRGQFQSPNAGYKAEKLKKWGFVYPILKASGALERSLTDPGDSNALFEVRDGHELVLGTRLTSRGAPYPKFLNDGTSKMPARPFLSIPQLSVARWKLILKSFLIGRLNPGGPGAAAAKVGG
jgi:hypothetical protein